MAEDGLVREKGLGRRSRWGYTIIQTEQMVAFETLSTFSLQTISKLKLRLE